jgi:hypothetical protein
MATFRPIYPRQKDPAPTVQEAEWALWLVWWVRNTLLTLRFEPHTVQLARSRYTDYVIQTAFSLWTINSSGERGRLR